MCGIAIRFLQEGSGAGGGLLPADGDDVALGAKVHHAAGHCRGGVRGLAELAPAEDVEALTGLYHHELPGRGDRVELAVHTDGRAEEVPADALHPDLLSGRRPDAGDDAPVAPEE